MCQFVLFFCFTTVVGGGQTKPQGFARPEVVANRLAARLERDQRVKTKLVVQNRKAVLNR